VTGCSTNTTLAGFAKAVQADRVLRELDSIKENIDVLQGVDDSLDAES
jgi:hypothetical protein